MPGAENLTPSTGTKDPRNEVGRDATVTVKGKDIPVTNVSWDIEQETSSSDFNDTARKFTGATSFHITGTIEIDGTRMRQLRRSFLNDDGVPQNSTFDVEIILKEEGIVFENVLLNNYSGDVPANDKTSRTVDFEADTYRMNR